MAAHHNDGAFQDFKKMFKSESEDSLNGNYDQFLQYVQAHQLIRIADTLEELLGSFNDIEPKVTAILEKLNNE